ncbi:redoxin domain-containing protein [Sphingomonas sp. HDW15A]|uniref:cytochrome c biogenesis protein DipZ n=1 Tax=Sphingomonas sp. HDW15A TaxID=2714942 RepID=UPI00140BCA3C|nr:cytochrome c biogenesis protein CcdA [Sphingomonas sp. HDW15A]QIK96308.1 redoxin domain-containing protein [Sphingomonas sp. HDW15A]
MLVILLAYLGGVLTILSPCILPVLPFVFARADRPFLTNGLPLLTGMAFTFALFASLAAFGGEAALAANQWGRWIALALLAAFALLLIFPALSERAMRPLVDVGNRLANRSDGGGIGSSLLLGAATGLLWAPCAGPILGLILTGAALGGASATTGLLLFAYAAGAATSLALALLIGGRVYAAMKRSVGAGEKVRQALGVLILAGVAAIAFRLDTKVLARLSSGPTNQIERALANWLGMGDTMPSSSTSLNDKGPMPSLKGATAWFNSAPLTREQLRGKVVLVDFWTYSCINCIRTIPHVRAWAERYSRDGLVVLGVHTPEFAFERDPANVRRAVADFRIRYPVAMDNDWTIWRAFNNRYWPAHYLFDANGRLRHYHFGEGGEDETEAAIRRLLAEAGQRPESARAQVESGGASAASSGEVATSETYLGFGRAENFVSPGGFAKGSAKSYFAPSKLGLGQWAYNGPWTVSYQRGQTAASDSSVSIRFRARDLHLVLGSASGRPVRFRITLDGKAPGADAGIDVDAAGNGVIREQRLYQLVRHKQGSRERSFTITFAEPGAEAYAFTFG